MATYTITKKNGEQISFDTDLMPYEAHRIIRKDIDQNGRPLKGFAFDLLQAYEQHQLGAGNFSNTQKLWLLKLAADLLQPARTNKSSFQGLVDAITQMQTGRKARVILRLQGLQIKACSVGGNTGGVYLARGDAYLGKITRDGRLVLSGALDEQGGIALDHQLIEAAADPQAAAIAYGRASGECACCGRDLSDPVSVWGGIGPICLENMAGADARKQLERAFKSTRLATV